MLHNVPSTSCPHSGQILAGHPPRVSTVSGQRTSRRVVHVSAVRPRNGKNTKAKKHSDGSRVTLTGAPDLQLSQGRSSHDDPEKLVMGLSEKCEHMLHIAGNMFNRLHTSRRKASKRRGHRGSAGHAPQLHYPPMSNSDTKPADKAGKDDAGCRNMTDATPTTGGVYVLTYSGFRLVGKGMEETVPSPSVSSTSTVQGSASSAVYILTYNGYRLVDSRSEPEVMGVSRQINAVKQEDPPTAEGVSVSTVELPSFSSLMWGMSPGRGKVLEVSPEFCAAPEETAANTVAEIPTTKAVYKVNKMSPEEPVGPEAESSLLQNGLTALEVLDIPQGESSLLQPEVSRGMAEVDPGLAVRGHEEVVRAEPSFIVNGETQGVSSMRDAAEYVGAPSRPVTSEENTFVTSRGVKVIGCVDDFWQVVDQAGDRFVVVLTESENITQSGLDEEPEIQWKYDNKWLEEPARKLMGSFHEAADLAYQHCLFAKLTINSEEARTLADTLEVSCYPSIQFWKQGLLYWEHRGVYQGEQALAEGLLYYAGCTLKGEAVGQQIHQIYTAEDYFRFINHQPSNVLTLVNVSLMTASPCIRLYPALAALAKSFQGCVAMSRVIGDSTSELLDLMHEDLRVVEAPTCIFYREGREISRLVSSNKADMVGHILMHLSNMGVQPPPPPARTLNSSVPAPRRRGAGRRRGGIAAPLLTI